MAVIYVRSIPGATQLIDESCDVISACCGNGYDTLGAVFFSWAQATYHHRLPEGSLTKNLSFEQIRDKLAHGGVTIREARSPFGNLRVFEVTES